MPGWGSKTESQGFEALGKGQAAFGLSVVCAAGAADFAGAGAFFALAFLAGAAFFAGAAFLAGAAFFAGAAFLAGAAFFTGAAFLAGAAFFTGAAFFAAGFFAVAINISLINLQRALFTADSGKKRSMWLGWFPAT